MNVRLEAINLLRKLHRGLSFNYTDSELKEITEFLAGKITKEEKLNERVKKLLLVIKSQGNEIADYKRIIKDNVPKTKAKELITYNYLELKTINKALEVLIKEYEDELKHNKAYCPETLIYEKNLAENIMNKNKEKIKEINLIEEE